MKKILALLFILVLVVSSFTSCKQSTENVTVKVAALKGPTGMGMSYLIDDSNNGKTEGSYTFEVCASPDEVTSRIVSGELDIAAVPTNTAATLYNKTDGKVQLLCLNTECVLYILEKGDTINSVEDLKGKTIYVSGQGSTPEYVLEYVLEQNGLEVGKDVTLDFTYSTHSDLVAFAASGNADVVLLPEPTVTALLAKNSDFRVAINIDEVWGDLVDGTEYEGSEVAMGCLIVNAEFAKNNPEAVATFLKEYKASVEKVTDEDNLDAAASVITNVGIVENENVAKMALPRCNICFKSGSDMKAETEGFLKVLYDAQPDSVGGKLPDEDFYYIAK